MDSYFEDVMELPWPKLDEEMMQEVRGRAARLLAEQCLYFRKDAQLRIISTIQTFFELGYQKGRADALEEDTV